MPPKKTFGERFAVLPNIAQNAVARQLSLEDLRALAQSDARWKPLARRHMRQYEDALGAVRDARRVRERAVVERAVLQQRRDGLEVATPTETHAIHGWSDGEKHLRALAVLDHIRVNPSLGREMYKRVVEETRGMWPGSIVDFVELDSEGWWVDQIVHHPSQTDPRDAYMAEMHAEVSVFVYFVDARKRRRVEWMRFELLFVQGGRWELRGLVDIYEGEIENLGYHLPWLLLPTGKLERL